MIIVKILVGLCVAIIALIIIVMLLWLISAAANKMQQKTLHDEYDFIKDYITNTCAVIVDGSLTSRSMIANANLKLDYVNNAYTTFMSLTPEPIKTKITTLMNGNQELYIKYTLFSAVEFVSNRKFPKMNPLGTLANAINRSNIDIDIPIDNYDDDEVD